MYGYDAMLGASPDDVHDMYTCYQHHNEGDLCKDYHIVFPGARKVTLEVAEVRLLQ